MGKTPVIARAAPHFDEEPIISGTRGSGTVFFSGCPLKCVYCQNFEVSRGRVGAPATAQDLRRIYGRLIDVGVHNINLVTAGHFADAVIESLSPRLPVPVVYNTSGYESVSTLKQLEGYIDIYLPDLKYMDAGLAGAYSSAPDYPEVATDAIREMYRQVGGVQLNPDGTARRGLMIRHLALPGATDNTIAALRWISGNFPSGVWVSLMAQYLPCGEAAAHPPLDRRLTRREYDMVTDELYSLGIENGYVQELSSADEVYIPDFDLTGTQSELGQ